MTLISLRDFHHSPTPYDLALQVEAIIDRSPLPYPTEVLETGYCRVDISIQPNFRNDLLLAFEP